jgi:hypothetical protein
MGKLQGKLPLWGDMAQNEVLQALGDIFIRAVASPFDLLGHLCRGIPGPFLGRVEGNNSQRIRILTPDEIGHHSLKVGSANIGFAPNAPGLTKAIEDEINGVVSTDRDDRWA